MKTYRLVISTPDGDVWSGEAIMLSVRGVAGELAVMAGHIPFITAVVACDCRIELDDETGEAKTLIGHVEGGLLTVNATQTTLLTGGIEWKSETDV